MIALLLALGLAQPSHDPPPEAAREGARGMPTLDLDCPGAEQFGGTELERAAFCALAAAKYVSVRTLADRALEADPKSFRAHYLMGTAQHLGEGNLPKSLHHLSVAEERLAAVGTGSETDEEVARRTLLELVYVHGEMDHHEEKLRYADLLTTRSGFDYAPLKAWPLLKLKRFDEARRIAEDALATYADPRNYWRSLSLTALCAIESESRRRAEAYAACKAAADPVVNDESDGGVVLSNAAAAALEVFKIDEAERLLLAAAARPPEGTINPWGRLAHLYLRQGRLPEALSAIRNMKQYRLMRPPYFDQQDQADAEMVGASLLVVAGRLEDALRITTRAVARPDRQGMSSASADQNVGGNLLIDRAVRLSVARALEEEASWSPIRAAIVLRLRAARLRAEAFVAARKVAGILANEERLLASMRPECPGSLELPNWLDPEIVSVVGPEIAREAVRRAREEETLDPSLAGPVFALFEAEAALADGDDAEAERLAVASAEGLLPSEVLLGARAAAIAAEALRRQERLDVAQAHYGRALLADPGVFRRLGLSIPVAVEAREAADGVVRAVDHVTGSPRFTSDPEGLILELSSAELVLRLGDGSELLRVRVPAGPNDPEALARRIARAAHVDLLEPLLDITQADIHSLDGSLGAGQRASERAKSILENLSE